MENILEILSSIFIFTGSVFVLIAVFGMAKMKDYFTRAHSAGIIDSLCLPLIITGVFMRLFMETDSEIDLLKLLIIVIFSIVTSATSTHALSKAAVFDLKPTGKKDKDYDKDIK